MLSSGNLSPRADARARQCLFNPHWAASLAGKPEVRDAVAERGQGGVDARLAARLTSAFPAPGRPVQECDVCTWFAPCFEHPGGMICKTCMEGAAQQGWSMVHAAMREVDRSTDPQLQQVRRVAICMKMGLHDGDVVALHVCSCGWLSRVWPVDHAGLDEERDMHLNDECPLRSLDGDA